MSRKYDVPGVRPPVSAADSVQFVASAAQLVGFGIGQLAFGSQTCETGSRVNRLPPDARTSHVGVD
jgi:hypothetical protein